MSHRRIACGALGLGGVLLMIQALWIPSKALLAQHLIAGAYAESMVTGIAVPPWPWADTSPVGRLSVPRLALERYVLANASPRSLAFGPGLIGSGTNAGSGLSIAGHRDTHFAFLGELVIGDLVLWEDRHGRRSYRIAISQVADSRSQLLASPAADELQLSTCWPLHDWQPGGPLRLLLVARAVSP